MKIQWRAVTQKKVKAALQLKKVSPIAAKAVTDWMRSNLEKKSTDQPARCCGACHGVMSRP
jgi:hypothetical protein